jgi:hypothetical protein
MMRRLKKRKINRGEFDAFRQGHAQKAPGKRTATADRYRKADLAEEVPQQVDQKPPAKRDDKTDPNKPADAQAAGAPAVVDPKADQVPDVEVNDKEITPSFLPVFDPEPDAEKE